ncbi:MAG TPA: hypothetical protein VIB00_16895 [Pyrinomonadaceae bacterium]|jgi:hypothetical protein
MLLSVTTVVTDLGFVKVCLCGWLVGGDQGQVSGRLSVAGYQLSVVSGEC